MKTPIAQRPCYFCAYSMVSNVREGQWICLHENSRWPPLLPNQHPVYMEEPLELCVDFENDRVVNKSKYKRINHA